MRAWTRSLLLIAAILVGGSSPAAASAAQERDARPLAIGYLPAFRGLEAATAGADFTQYTHLNLAFVNPDRAGNILAGKSFACAEGGTSGMLDADKVRALAKTVHKAGSKLLISLGGGAIPACSGEWDVLLRPETRDRVVANLIEAVDRLGLDGIDVDIEGALLTKIDKAGDFLPFVQALSRALKARGKLLGCATASYDGGMVPQGSIPYFDLVGVMSYDAIGTGWGEPGAEHASVEQARKDIDLWLSRGVPREKLALGLPFYGYGYGRFKPNYSFREIRDQFPEAALLTDVIGSRCAGCSYVTFNGLPTLLEKARLARAKAGGIMVWEISHDSDDHILIRSINQELARAPE